MVTSSLYCSGTLVRIVGSNQGQCDACTKIAPMLQPRHIAQKKHQPTQLNFQGFEMPNANPHSI